MSFLGDLFNPVEATQDTWSGLASLPGTPEALGTGIYGGLNGDLSWNPYSQDNSVWDTGAGGTQLSEDPTNRQYGRAIGTAIGAAFTGGALGAVGEGAGAGATNAALADSAVGSAGYGASSASAGSSLGGAVGSGAARGAAVNAGTTAAQGGNGSDILKAGAIGGVTGGAAGGISYTNPAQYVGIENQGYGRAFNSALSGGVNSVAKGGNFGEGALYGGLSSGLNTAGTGIADYFKGNNGMGSLNGAPDVGTLGGTYSPDEDGMYKGENSATLGGEQTPMAQALSTSQPYAGEGYGGAPSGGGDHPMGQFFSGLLGNGGLGQIANGGLALYSAMDARRRYNNATNSINDMYSPNSAYAQQMGQSLARKDAAAGRNSQYGTRAVQLAAALTNSRAGALTSAGYGNLLGQQQKAYGQLPITAAAMLQSNWGKGLLGSGTLSLNQYFNPGPTNFVQPGGVPTDANNNQVFD